MTERATEQIPLDDGSVLRLTVVEPDGAQRGGIVVVHEAHGVTDAVLQLADGLAAEGWLAVVPHLFHRDGHAGAPADQHPDEVRGRVERLSADSVLADTDASFRWLARRGVSADLMGVVGFELGGSVALIVASQRVLGAAVSVAAVGVLHPLSAELPALVQAAPELQCPWLGIYGSEDVPDDEVQKLREAAESAQVATDLVHFPDGTYRFDTDQSAAVEAWARTLNWFDSHLR